MSDSAFIFMLVLGMTVLAGILTVTHVSASRLKQRLRLRRQNEASAEPELDLSGIGLRDLEAPQIAVRVRHPETAR